MDQSTTPIDVPSIQTNAPFEVFSSFKIKYPEYSIITPQSLKEFTIRSLSVSEEENMKSSLTTPNKLVSHLNKCIFDCLVKKPDDIKTYNDFITKLTIKDRDALMYGLYHITYKEIHNYDITCMTCDKKYPVSLKVSKAFSMQAWTDTKTPVLEKEIKVKLPIAQNITAVIRQPTLQMEEDLTSDMLFQGDQNLAIGTEMLIIKRFEIESTTPQQPMQIIQERDNIFLGYKELPSIDRKEINKAYIEHFGNYGVTLKMATTCVHCSTPSDVDLDLVSQFFRTMYE